MLIGYARTSTDEQAAGLADQEVRLNAAGCERIYREHASAAEGKERPQLEALLGFLREGDTMAIVKLDRLARSLTDLLLIVRKLDERSVGLRVLDLGGAEMDTRSPVGKLFLAVLGAIAEFERDLMLDRQRAGIAAAKVAGKYVGRQPTARRKADEVRRLASEGVGPSEIARRLHIGRSSVYRALSTTEGEHP